MPNQFNYVKNLSPGRSVFDLSYDKKFNCDMAQLIPILCDEMVPGDSWQIGNEIVCRFQPLIAPILHEINIYTHYFFVPYRLLWDDWEMFMTGGKDGDFTATLPTWTTPDTSEFSLWDYMGLPTKVDPVGAYPLDFPRSAYNFIYNEYYRDETLQNEIALDNDQILNRAWEKDYWTSSLIFQQRGTAPGFVAGAGSANWDTTTVADTVGGTPIGISETVSNDTLFANTSIGRGNYLDHLNSNTVDLSAFGFDISDLRLAFQTQKFLERNARSGYRYTEWLQSHFSVSPTDDRLDRPEFCGGSKSPVIISEVLQTTQTLSDGTPQGNLAGHGLSADRTRAASYKCKEYGLMMGIMSVMPRSAYQQGINRQWLKETRYDFFLPEFVNLSEQAIEQAEIYATDVEVDNRALFGYQGRFDEMRVKNSMVCGSMRSNATISFDYWHLGRDFDSAPETNPPLLNEEFITCIPSKRIFAVQDEPGLIINCANLIKAVRPLPAYSNPGLIDHH